MKLLPLLFALSTRRQAFAFVANYPCTTKRCTISSRSTGLAALPTVNDVGADDFMKQLGHASQIIPLLHPQEGDDGVSDEESAALLEVLCRQFSHSDGIRGVSLC